ncbi:beta-lactamase [Knoellia sinensis KCTC 19936]|uniref:Beta-lactamase n=1 Tax=Knoellia sinensis KCTC 19936 TaxID=1385520 RepID=A0A0A0IYJ9_9MICO|nr:serine hydrolase domain-containing protein [Knoellia sinensis]KGN30290.1 beta-lactamase [Knoellia sinensis KCTC 19936]
MTARFAERLGSARPVAAAAVVTSRPEGGFDTELAHVGPGADGDYEIGSISKGITGLLYADAMDRGEVAPDATLADHLPLAGTAVGGVTLASIATHESGLPRVASGLETWRRTWEFMRHGTNPYREDLDQLVEQARSVRLRAPRHRYSNLGFELLGHAVAEAVGVPYAVLVRSRIAEPLGLDPFYVPMSEADLLRTAVRGRSRRGGNRPPWVSEAIGPAGGIRASVEAMAGLTRALLDGSAPGVRALDPAVRVGRSSHIGIAWHTMKVRDRDVTWHNGGTGGFRSWIGVDRAAGRGVVVLCASAALVDGIGLALLVPRR